MTEAQIRSRFLREHARIQGKMEVLESLVLGVLRGDAELTSVIRCKGEELQRNLLMHMQWEEEQLFPTLRGDSASGLKVADALDREHVSQRGRLAEVLEALRCKEEAPSVLAERILEWIRSVEDDIDFEEERVLALFAPESNSARAS